MSTYGTETRTYFQLSVTSSRTSEDYQAPSRPTYHLLLNGLELSIRFWRARLTHWVFLPGSGLFGTPWFLLEVSWYHTFMVDVSADGDYPEDRS
jgi:hypothetical protein